MHLARGRWQGHRARLLSGNLGASVARLVWGQLEDVLSPSASWSGGQLLTTPPSCPHMLSLVEGGPFQGMPDTVMSTHSQWQTGNAGGRALVFKSGLHTRLKCMTFRKYDLQDLGFRSSVSTRGTIMTATSEVVQGTSKMHAQGGSHRAHAACAACDSYQNATARAQAASGFPLLSFHLSWKPDLGRCFPRRVLPRQSEKR